MSSHGTRNWNDIAAVARRILDRALDRFEWPEGHDPDDWEELRTLLETVDASRDEPTEADPPGACGHPIDPNDPHVIHAAPCEARNWPESCNADACSCSRICVACCAVCGPRPIVARYLLNAPEQGDWPWEDHCDGMAGGIVEALRAAGALVGGRSAAPTREQIDAKAIWWANQFARKASDAGTHFTEEGVLTLAESFADAVVALLSRPAAEPPEVDREQQLLAQIEERRGDEAFMRRLRARIYQDRPLLDQLGGVAAEPNEGHGDGA